MSWVKRLRKPYDGGISTEKDYRSALPFSFWQDHGLLRTIWKNELEIAPGVWRSNQPDRKRLAEWKERGLTRIVNLRAPNDAFYHIEDWECREFRLELLNFPMPSYRPPTPDQITSFVHLLEGLQKPFVMHCKSGADRTAIASALYLIAIEKAPIEKVLGMFSIKHVHLAGSRKGVLKQVFLDYWYETHYETDFMTWVKTQYDPERAKANFAERRKNFGWLRTF
jgi:protein tyrosine phosphatase (PTP) superfamily phosphohydrolase (DUF442 family)